MAHGNGGPVLAIYDFRSKQEYIYRTNRMREIAGASELIAGMYKHFLTETEVGRRIRNDWEDCSDSIDIRDGEAGVVVYEGGGNLCVLYRDRNTYTEANKAFSLMVIAEGYSLSVICGCAEWEDGESFGDVRSRAYRALDVCKRTGLHSVPCNALSFTQVDATTFQPIVEKARRGDNLVELTQESVRKLSSYEARAERDPQWKLQGKHVDDIGTEKGEDSLIAVVYFDGNSIGNRLKRQGGSVGDMRRFSKEVHEVLVTQTEAAMKEALEGMPDDRQRSYRIIIDHGDEITLICNAHAAPLAVRAYFQALACDAESKREQSPDYQPYHACAGIAFCHAHDPFSEVYRIAEQCCESGKEQNRRFMREAEERGEDPASVEGSFVDFHFCRSGITGSLEQIRNAQEGPLTKRPYQIGADFDTFLEVGRLLVGTKSGEPASKIRRSDMKELGRAILRGDSWYSLEYERLKAKDPESMASAERIVWGGAPQGSLSEIRLSMRNLLFDLASFMDVFDVCLGASDAEGGAQNA